MNQSKAIRNSCEKRLLEKLKVKRETLMDLFVDRTAINVSLFGDFDYEKYKKYEDCMKLNDENTIRFNQSNNFDIDVDESHNMFIPR